jgi:hypothetical protein
MSKKKGRKRIDKGKKESKRIKKDFKKVRNKCLQKFGAWEYKCTKKYKNLCLFSSTYCKMRIFTAQLAK